VHGIDPPVAGDAHYADRVIAGLDADFARGAVACKIWKNIGMEVRDADGRFVMVDDAVLEPVLRHLERMDRTLMVHTGEPRACWEPLDGGSHHAEYYRGNPEWHMHGRSDVPSYEQLVASRDRMLARYPRLRVVGAHLGSHEHDVRELAARFDAYPNFAADTGARIYDLALQDRAAVREFFERYGDRVLYGNDFCASQPTSRMPVEERTKFLGDLKGYFDDARAFYGGDTVRLRGRTFAGLGLSEDLQQAFFEGNARRWYPA
jgi:predicted TIM-barrel fold metal-dependent hydrolase